MNLWLDDERDPREHGMLPPGESRWHHQVKTAPEAIAALNSGKITHVSLDHDLGPPEAGTGYDVTKHIEAGAFHGTIPRLTWHVHSQNPVGRADMIRALKSADRFWAMNEAVEFRAAILKELRDSGGQ